MNNIIDITKKINNKIQNEEKNKELLDIADLIKDGYITEIIGVIGDCNGNYYISMPRDKGNNPIKAKDFKQLLSEYVDKIPTYK